MVGQPESEAFSQSCGNDEVGHVLADCFLARSIESPLRCRIELQNSALGINAYNAVQSGGHDRTIERLACADGSLGSFALGNVADDVDLADDFSGSVAIRRAVDFCPEKLTVPVPQLDFIALGDPRMTLRKAVPARLFSRGMGEQLVSWTANQLLRRATRDLRHARIHIQNHIVQVANEQPLAHALDDRTEACFRLP